MSKKWKQNIRELLKTVEDGLAVLDTMNSAALMEVLQTMQEAVIHIGNSIDKQIADCEQMMETLTELAEMIYELSIDGSHRKCHKLEKTKALCKKAEKEIDAGIPDVYEILFMPYKVSMWDALETIYETAMLEKDCHVTVMPIPYYHMTEDRSNVELQYEGNQFPSNITITDYREYNIAEKLPDAIFIHNPYDDHNRVTQIPQCYFSSELVKYTEHLVYIPYKVCSGKVRDGFCVMPGVRNAWRVFVQSEQVREVYVKYNPQEKIIVTGSPKIDKVIQSAQCLPAMPKEWEAAFEGKKVFLLNTHLNSIINKAEQMIKSVEQLIALFEGREDIALLWRPHPLSIETARAMNPEALQTYQELVKRFKKLKNGIYDQSSSPHPAIAISDAYIGDWSSMVTLFGVTGKPVFVRYTLEGESLLNRNMESLCFSDAVQEGDELWFCARDFMELFRYNLKTGLTHYVGGVDCEICGEAVYTTHIFKEGKKLLLVAEGKQMHYIVYQIDTGESYELKALSPETAQKVSAAIRDKHTENVIEQKTAVVGLPRDWTKEKFLDKALRHPLAGEKLKSIYYEKTIALETFVEMIVKGQDIRSEYRKKEFADLFARTDGNSGKLIWEYVKNALEG